MYKDYYYDDNFEALLKDFHEDKQIVLFLGAGINISGNNGLDWNALLDSLFSEALTFLSIEKGIKGQSRSDIRNIFDASQDQLSDMLLDIVISKMVYQVTKTRLKDPDQYMNSTFCDYMFNTHEIKLIPDDHRPVILPNDLKTRLDMYLGKDIVYYNNRTNALHIRRSIDESDDQSNMLYFRKHDFINKYCEDKAARDTLGELKNEIFPVYFNTHRESKEKNNNYDFTDSPIQELRSILNHVENRREKDELPHLPCIVLDGVTQMTFDDLKSINFTHMERVFRHNASVSILVFDEPEVVSSCNADIVIEMCKVEEPIQKYTYHRLRITKSVFQPSAIGWHQYKKRDYGIEVYCSPHLLIQKHRHMPRVFRSTNLGIMELSYEKYRTEYNDIDPQKYILNKAELEKQKLEGLLKARKAASPEEILKNIFLRPVSLKNTDTENKDKEDCGIVTAVIGKPNTYKRFFAMGYAFSACSKNEHTLVVLLDKDENIMVKQMLCPAKKLAGETESGDDTLSNYENCKDCYLALHSFEVRMGCIGADEFFYYLKEQIELSETCNRPIRRIVVDDLQKIDYSFPFLQQDPLFLTGLISLCKDMDVDLFILCDKKAKLADELKALADNVVYMKRKIKDKDAPASLPEEYLTVYVDKHAAADLSSRTYTYEIKDIHHFIVCKNEMCNKKKSLDFRYKESVQNVLVNGIKYKKEPEETENNAK